MEEEQWLGYIRLSLLQISMLRLNKEVICIVKISISQFCMVSCISHDHCLVLILFQGMLFIVATVAIPTSNLIFQRFYFTYNTVIVNYIYVRRHQIPLLCILRFVMTFAPYA